MPQPINLILYGPPGTGKTYATARHAVRLCTGVTMGDDSKADRDALMAEYQRLVDADRIAFITFHQSFSYEEFVEGLRPHQDGEGEGFSLRPRDGILKRMAAVARTAVASDVVGFSAEDRQIFKMSIGDIRKTADAPIFGEAIETGFAFLGFADIDWSGEAFKDRKNILAACEAKEIRTEFGQSDRIGLKSGPVISPDHFRNTLKIGDLIVVGKGRDAFRAIGIVEGPYEYAPRPYGRFCHRRKVRWLWHDEKGAPLNEISSKRFALDTIYPLTKADLNIERIEEYVSRGSAPSEPAGCVLVIDEINRANISKVFGELITLVEPDKRLGGTNALTVTLPYSNEPFGVPANLHIIGTMNTADRSIALLDTALRRRFDFEELMPEPDRLLAASRETGIDLTSLLRGINDRIEYLYDREHQIGHAFFMHCRTREDVDQIMRRKVIPLLQEYFYEDWEKVAQALGDGEAVKTAKGRFLLRTPLPVPEGVDAGGGERWRWSTRDSFDYPPFAA